MLGQPKSAVTSGAIDAALEDVIAEITDRLQAGQPVDIAPYVVRHPEWADRLQRVLPALVVMAGLANSLDDASAGDERPGEESLAGTLGDFRIVREVGRGGMGVVYEAEQISLKRRVALKVLPLAGTLDPRRLQRFHNEARAAACLHHTNIVPVFAVGSERGVHFYAMQLIEGQTLADMIHHQRGPAPAEGAGPPSATAAATPQAAASSTVPQARHSTAGPAQDAAYFRTVAELAAQAAEALDYAHQMGVVHRDIKPANLMLETVSPLAPPGRGAGVHLWITDFGLAQLQADAGPTLTGDLVGTLRYMSPEQALAQRVVIDHRTDVYSLGATLYELLALRPVFAGSDRQELLRQIAFDEPTPPRRLNRAIPAELETIVLKALEKNPADRYSTAQELAADLRRFLEEKPILARRPTLIQCTRKWTRRHQGLVWAAAGMLLLTTAVSTVAVAVIAQERDGAIRQRALADQERDRARSAHYAASMHLTYDAWRAADMDEARALLDAFIPRRGQRDLRGWEWQYLHALCHRACFTLSSPGVEDDKDSSRPGGGRLFYMIAWSPDGQRLATAGGPGNRRTQENVRGTIDVLGFGHRRNALQLDRP